MSDTGIGLSDEERQELFQPFQQARPSTTREYGGTGLGLAICRSLAEALGGTIVADSVPGQGSTFTFVLYQAIDAQTDMVAEHGLTANELAQESNALPSTHRLSGHVLLAEDGLDNQLLISTILRRAGLDVDIAENGDIAVNRTLDALAAGRPYDLVLMDMQMPKLDGYGAATKLRSKGYTGPIVALTAHAMKGERQRCLQAGCDDYLTKPIGRTVLLAAVDSHLSRVRGGQLQPGSSEMPVSGHLAADEVPIYSIYANDPDMYELVAGFAERLPQQAAALQAAADQCDSDTIRHLAHQIKGAAGGYGFMPVSEQAASLESVAKKAPDWRDIDDAVKRFARLCRRVRCQAEPGANDDE